MFLPLENWYTIDSAVNIYTVFPIGIQQIFFIVRVEPCKIKFDYEEETLSIDTVFILQ